MGTRKCLFWELHSSHRSSARGTRSPPATCCVPSGKFLSSSGPPASLSAVDGQLRRVLRSLHCWTWRTLKLAEVCPPGPTAAKTEPQPALVFSSSLQSPTPTPRVSSLAFISVPVNLGNNKYLITLPMRCLLSAISKCLPWLAGFTAGTRCNLEISHLLQAPCWALIRALQIPRATGEQAEGVPRLARPSSGKLIS